MQSEKDNSESQTVKKDSNVSETFKTPSISAGVTDIRGKEKHSNPCTVIGEIETDAKVEDVSNQKTTITNASDRNKYLSPAEQLKHNQVAIPYKEPSWGGISEEKYSFDVLKNGTITGNVDLTEKSFYVFGRLPSCDVTMEHPSLSRYHAVVQYCKNASDLYEKGWYLFDLDSTHGTWLNKRKIEPQIYYRIRVGHVLKFGGSTRLNILQGPEWDSEDESELTVTEMKQQKERQKKELELLRQVELLKQEVKIKTDVESKDESGCSWGMDEDAVDEMEENPFAADVTPENEQLYLDDPKKALKGFFEREGYDPPEYDIVDAGRGKFRCCVELPVDTPSGEPLVAEATVSAKKREAVVACALEACRIIDRMGLLRAAKHESRKRKSKNWEQDDFYDSDEDTYLDRTGTIEKKREFRMKKVGKVEKKAESYESLVKQHEDVVKEIEDIDKKIADAKAQEAAMESDDVDALDAYMLAIKSGVMDTKTRMKLKRQLIELRKEEQRLRKYVNLAKPTALPTLKIPENKPLQKENSSVKTVSKVNPVIGKMKGFDSQHRVPKLPLPVGTVVNDVDDNFEVEEEEEDEEETEVYKNPKTTQDLSRVQGPSVAQPLTDDTTSNKPDSGGSKNIVKTLHPYKGFSRTPTDLQNIRNDRKVEEEKKIKDKSKSMKPDKNKHEATKVLAEYDPTDPDYAAWLPPAGQSGDGKTHLNAKFGY